VKTVLMVNEVRSMKTIARMMVVMAGMGAGAWAQAPTAPVMSPATADAAQVGAPQAPAANATAPVDPFPPVNLKNFTASSPTTAEVNAFLKQAWGFDDNRIWSIAAILKTQAPGVARVVVFAVDKAHPDKVSRNEFFVTPDGKHAIASGVIDFGPTPFADRRALLQQEADGPAEGAAGKDLLIVLFADFLNGRSKDAQEVASNLVKDIPQARLMIEYLPADGSPYAFHAAAEGACVRKAKGDAAFFTYAQEVYNRQKGLTAATLQAALDAAVVAAGADAKSVAACSATPETKAVVQASVALAAKAGVDLAPILVVNGRVLPPVDVPYDTLKRIVAYQAQLDGISVKVQPTLTNLK
jgi:protein-disulfide isomerase